jgi:predicted PurR-regulated permease PerM
MFGIDGRAARVVWTVLLFAAALALAWGLRRVLLLLAFAAVFAYVVMPLVRLTQSWRPLRQRRALAVGVVYLVLIAVLAAAGAAVGPRLRDEAGALAGKTPAISERLQSGHVVSDVLGRNRWTAPIAGQVDAYIRAHAQEWTGYGQRVAGTVLGYLAGVWVVVLVPIFAFFFLKDGEGLAAAVESAIETRPGRGLWRGITQDLHEVFGHYVRALIVLCLITFVVWSGVVLVAGVHYALLLAAVGGALEFIPVVGPLVAGLIVIGVHVFSGGGHALYLIAFLVGWRLVQDYVTSPLVMGGGVELHPALVIFGVIAGGEIAGVPGMFFSVPVLAGLRVIWRRVDATRHAGAGTVHGDSVDAVASRAAGSRASRAR